jgi:hypothetical protein
MLAFLVLSSSQRSLEVLQGYKNSSRCENGKRTLIETILRAGEGRIKENERVNFIQPQRMKFYCLKENG